MSLACYRGNVDGPITRIMALASTTGFVLSGNIKIFIPKSPIALMTRTITIALANGLRCHMVAVNKVFSDDLISLNSLPSCRVS